MGEAKYLAHIIQEDNDMFYANLKAAVETCNERELIAEVQYSPLIRSADGLIYFTAVVIGRTKEGA